MNPDILRKILPLALCILALAACSEDDPVRPENPAVWEWQEVDLEPTDDDSRVIAR
jgi:hypothetical protein